MLEQLPTDTEEAGAALKSENARQAFFTIYFNCIRHQVSLRLRSLGVTLDWPVGDTR
jgi:hypothetical protein